VALPAIQFDDLALLGPKAVDLEALVADEDPLVETGARQVVATKEGVNRSSKRLLYSLTGSSFRASSATFTLRIPRRPG
jgi:hypothetical protein